MDLKTFGIRTLISLIFGPLILLSAWFGGFWFLGVIQLLSLLALFEFYNLSQAKEATPLKILGGLFSFAITFLFYLNFLSLIFITLISIFVCVVIVELFRNKPNPILNVSVTLFGLFFVTFPFGLLLFIRELESVSIHSIAFGKLIILIFLAIWLCDSAAYIVGSKIGKHKLFPRVSPNKSIEGTLAGFVVAVLTAYISSITFLSEFSLNHILVIGAICGSFGQMSDLVESLFKRDAKVKDSSALIPGHGGVLDRFDSEILVVPVVFLYLKFVVF